MFVFLDTETGGLTTDCSLLEIAAVVTDRGFNVVDEYHAYVKPESGKPYAVHPQALAINGINLIDHDAKAQSYNQVYSEFFAFLKKHRNEYKDRLTPAGHNVDFDRRFIIEHLLITPEWDSIFNYRVADTASFAQYLILRGMLDVATPKLATLAQVFGLPEQKHSALEDARLTVEVMKRLLHVQ